MSLEFILLPPLPVEGEELVTTARLGVAVEGERVWPTLEAEDVYLEIQIDDLLSHLTEFWKPLVLRQTYPIISAPNRPSELRTKAEERWERKPAVAEREDELVSAFEDAHDLAHCFDGYFDLPPLWMLRSGERMIIDTWHNLKTVAFADAIAELSRVGNEIADKLSAHSDRWQKIIDKWHLRDKGDPTTLLAWTTSLDKSVASGFVQEGLLSLPETVVDAANDNDELRIAARMASALPPDQIRQILSVIQSFGKCEAPALDRLGDEVSCYIAERFSHKRAHEQGEAAARFVRDQLSLPSQSAVDVEEIMRGLGIEIIPREVDPATLDALAVWGSHYGPAAMLNLKSARGGRRVPARVTLAHELCHLLLDRGHALSAIEILNSRMPLDVEKRAKSFAGEILLPSTAAVETWRREGSPRSLDQLKQVVKTLQNEFDVTRSVATWKLEHGLSREGIDLSVLLDAIAPYR